MTSPTCTTYHILNLGAGVQSTTLYLMFMRGEIQAQIDCAIFADTQEESQAVYRHLAWLQSLGGPPILVRTAGKLGDDLIHGVNSTGQRFVSIPAYTKAEGDAREGQLRRQCSKEYKSEVIGRTIRREVLGLLPGRRIPKDVKVHQYFGISLDEAGRARRITDRVRSETTEPHFPLIERSWTRPNCLTWLADKVPHQTPRSACVFCPYHSDAEWMVLRAGQNGDWARAIQIDQALRRPGCVVNRKMDKALYLHRSCKPLADVVFDARPKPRDLQLSLSFAAVCEGVCGV